MPSIPKGFSVAPFQWRYKKEHANRIRYNYQMNKTDKLFYRDVFLYFFFFILVLGEISLFSVALAFEPFRDVFENEHFSSYEASTVKIMHYAAYLIFSLLMLFSMVILAIYKVNPVKRLVLSLGAVFVALVFLYGLNTLFPAGGF